MNVEKLYKFVQGKIFGKIIKWIVLLLLVLVAGILWGLWNQSRHPKFDSTVIMGRIEQVQELVSTRYHYRDVSEYQKVNQFYGLNLPFTQERSIFVYGGTLTYGIDISKVQVSVDHEKKIVELTLPPEHKIAHEMNEDDVKIYNIEDSLFNEMKLEDYTYLVAGLKEEKEKSVLEDEKFQKEMREHTELAVRNAVISVLPPEYTVNILK